SAGDHGKNRVEARTIPLDSPELSSALEQHYIDRLRSETELLDVAGDPFDEEAVRTGRLTPMFFGSAVSNFGVEPFLTRFLRFAPSPQPRNSDQGPTDPLSPDFTGFIFKIQANMNPAHRDRLAFLRVCSGVFEKGMTVWHSGTDKPIQLKQPQQFMADERELVEDAYPGDIIGLFDPGIFALGDTLCTGPHIRYAGIPLFAPEYFARVTSVDSLKRKQFVKGVLQLSEEGAIQTFKRPGIGFEEIIVGVVGMLQFEVLEHRLRTEYNAEINRYPLNFRFVRWIRKTPKAPEDLKLSSTSATAKDAHDRDVLLFENEWSIRWVLEHNEGLELAETASRSGD
ncbi:MAG: peptide chain release factor 3, partial [Oscillospiraceae bacterium]|nr:peptide chain release factor 3 [Oscillospiraceae bacterium]